MKISMICVIAIAMTCVSSVGEAQVFVPGGGTTVDGGIFGPAPMQQGQVYHQQSLLLPRQQRRAMPHWAQPQHPDIVTIPSFDSYTPWGGVNTRNTQVDNTYWTPNRGDSRYNGSRRWVNRPVYDQFGNVTGYQQGEIWNNSVTGREHGNLQTVTPNGSGGSNSTTTLYSIAGGDITPMESK